MGGDAALTDTFGIPALGRGYVPAASVPRAIKNRGKRGAVVVCGIWVWGRRVLRQLVSSHCSLRDTTVAIIMIVGTERLPTRLKTLPTTNIVSIRRALCRGTTCRPYNDLQLLLRNATYRVRDYLVWEPAGGTGSVSVAGAYIPRHIFSRVSRLIYGLWYKSKLC